VECIAKALVIAVQYIADRDANHDEDSDVEQLESIAAILSEASISERRTLREASRELGLQDWPEQIGLRSESPGSA